MWLDNYHAQLRMCDTKRWMVDGKHLPQCANGDTPDSDRQLGDGSWCLQTVGRQLNLQESDNPLSTSTAPEIMHVHPLRFCTNRNTVLQRVKDKTTLQPVHLLLILHIFHGFKISFHLIRYTIDVVIQKNCHIFFLLLQKKKPFYTFSHFQ